MCYIHVPTRYEECKFHEQQMCTKKKKIKKQPQVHKAKSQIGENVWN